MYRGYPLVKEDLIKRLEWIVQSRPNVNGNLFGYCSICSQHSAEALSMSLNGRLPIAFKPGIRLSGEEFLQRFVDHDLSESHKNAMKAQKLKKVWKEKDSTAHPWLRTLKTSNYRLCEKLVYLAVDVYNDLKIGTISARSWPSRFLASVHAQQQVSRMSSSQQDDSHPFTSFVPDSAHLQYLSPDKYIEMSNILGKIELERLKSDIELSTCIGIQIDGSQDRTACDIKHLTSRLWVKGQMKTVFLGIY